jgi:hypothetical protein
MTPEERKKKVLQLREMHEDYFQTEGNINAAYIPKMAYRPSGKDELHVSFFPSELERNKDIYTEFVSIEYESEDPKRTLYLHRYNPHWKEEYELVESNSGFQRHLIPVSELKVVSDVILKQDTKDLFSNLQQVEELPNPDDNASFASIVRALNKIADSLSKIESKLNK